MKNKTQVIHYFKQLPNSILVNGFLDLLARLFDELAIKEDSPKFRLWIDEQGGYLQVQINAIPVLNYQIKDRKHLLGLLYTPKRAKDLLQIVSFENLSSNGEEELGLAYFVLSNEVLTNPIIQQYWLENVSTIWNQKLSSSRVNIQTNTWLYSVVVNSNSRKELLEAIKAKPKYQPLIPKTIAYLLQQKYFQHIQESTTFWFANAQQIWQEFREDTITKEAALICLEAYQKYEGRFDNFVIDATVKKYQKSIKLIGQLIAHIEDKATAKQLWNTYSDKRTIAHTGVRQNLWVQQLLEYKIQGNNIEALQTPAIQNAILYLQYPAEKMPVLSLVHQRQISNHILDTTYQPEQFTLQLISYFNLFEIKTKNFENYTFLIRELLYHENNRALWKYTDEDVYQSEIIEKIAAEPTANYKPKNKTNFPLNQIFYGPPGTGKTFESIHKAIAIVEQKDCNNIKQMDNQTIQDCLRTYTGLGQIMFTTFHQSMSYEDFVEGIKPELIAGQVNYIIKDGLLKLMAKNALQNPQKNHVLIIDELNRGNVSNIFGELITLLEEDKRQGAAHGLSIQLPYSKQAFALPANLYIIATMNTADRNIEHLDIALRRRFSFVEMLPDSFLLAENIGGINLRLLHQTINDRIAVLLDASHLLGHAYFMNVQDFDELQTVFKTQIIPLLLECFYGDCAKVGLVLGKAFVRTQMVSLQQMADFDYEGNERFWDKPSYEIKDFPLTKEAYIAVYEK